MRMVEFDPIWLRRWLNTQKHVIGFFFTNEPEIKYSFERSSISVSIVFFEFVCGKSCILFAENNSRRMTKLLNCHHSLVIAITHLILFIYSYMGLLPLLSAIFSFVFQWLCFLLDVLLVEKYVCPWLICLRIKHNRMADDGLNNKFPVLYSVIVLNFRAPCQPIYGKIKRTSHSN